MRRKKEHEAASPHHAVSDPLLDDGSIDDLMYFYAYQHETITQRYRSSSQLQPPRSWSGRGGATLTNHRSRDTIAAQSSKHMIFNELFKDMIAAAIAAALKLEAGCCSHAAADSLLYCDFWPAMGPKSASSEHLVRTRSSSFIQYFRGTDGVKANTMYAKSFEEQVQL